MTGILRLISTPIGNLEDLSPRAKEALTMGQEFLAEDTRVLLKLLDLCGIDRAGKNIESFNDHDQEKVSFLIEKYRGKDLCLVSDAGSPVLSDPAYPLVKAWIEAGGSIESLPGPSAVVMALEVSGLPPQPFCFHGFLPRKAGPIASTFSELSSHTTHIFFESPHRIIDTLNLLSQKFPDYDVCVVRELTKKFEEHYRFKASDWDEQGLEFKAKGEIVVLVRHESSADGFQSSEVVKLANKYMAKPSSKTLAKILGEITGRPTSEIYENLHSFKKSIY